jgi:hypothetical protein
MTCWTGRGLVCPRLGDIARAKKKSSSDGANLSSGLHPDDRKLISLGSIRRKNKVWGTFIVLPETMVSVHTSSSNSAEAPLSGNVNPEMYIKC